jgi:hypothetical protein
MTETSVDQLPQFGTDKDCPAVWVDGQFKSFMPSSSFEIRHYEYHNKVNIDIHGGRLTDSASERKVIPFLGNSFTFGVGVEDKETYVSLIALKGQNFLNLGVPGSALHSQIDTVELRHSELGHPRFYVFSIYIGNDLTDVYRYHKALPRAEGVDGKYQDSETSLLKSINELVYYNRYLKRLYTIQYIRQKILSLVNRYTDNDQLMNPVFRMARRDTSELDNASAYFDSELERLKNLADKLEFSFVFILLPDVNQVNDKLMQLKAKYYDIGLDQLDMLAPNKKLQESFKFHDIEFIDITDCLRGSENISALYYSIDNHFTKYGHEVSARCLEKEGFSSKLR